MMPRGFGGWRECELYECLADTGNGVVRYYIKLDWHAVTFHFELGRGSA